MNEESKDKLAQELDQTEELSEDLTEETEEVPDGKSKKAKKQIRKLEEHVAELEAKLKEASEQNLRLYAEFDNFRKRVTRERIEQLAMAGRDVVESLLPVVDDLDRAKESIEQASDASGAVQGFELISAKLKSLLEQRGLKAMACIGQPFDPELHEAVSEMEVEEEGQKGKVVHEVIKGYWLNDRIIRHAKVVVGK